MGTVALVVVHLPPVHRATSTMNQPWKRGFHPLVAMVFSSGYWIEGYSCRCASLIAADLYLLDWSNGEVEIVLSGMGSAPWLSSGDHHVARYSALVYAFFGLKGPDWSLRERRVPFSRTTRSIVTFCLCREIHEDEGDS